jgi:hypothetical protein
MHPFAQGKNAYVSGRSNASSPEYIHRSLPLSKSSSASMSLLITGPAALGSSFVRRAACSWTSPSSSSRNRPWVTGGAGAEVEGEPEEELPPLWARERTMSFLQIGQVRRRVVSHGVLSRYVSIEVCCQGLRMGEWRNLHARFMELMTTRQAHHTTDAIDILFQTNNTFALLSAISASPLCQTC